MFEVAAIVGWRYKGIPYEESRGLLLKRKI